MRDPDALARASALAQAEGAWPVRYAQRSDEPRLRDLFNQYRKRQDLSVYRLPDQDWTRARARAWVKGISHPLVVEKDGVVVGFLVVREPTASEPPTMTADCCPVDFSLTPAELRRAQLSLGATLLLFMKAKGYTHVELVVTPKSRSRAWADGVVTPTEAAHDGATGQVKQLRYTDTVDHALGVIRRLAAAI